MAKLGLIWGGWGGGSGGDRGAGEREQRAA